MRTPTPAARPRSARTRERLLAAAEAVFLARGVADTTLEDIAATAGLTRGAFYWHFRDKDTVLAALLRSRTLALERLTVLDAVPPTGTPYLRLADAIHDTLCLGRDHAWWDFLVREQRQPQVHRRLLRLRARVRRHALALLAAQAPPRRPPGRERHAVWLPLAAVMGLLWDLQHCPPERQPPCDDMARYLESAFHFARCLCDAVAG